MHHPRLLSAIVAVAMVGSVLSAGTTGAQSGGRAPPAPAQRTPAAPSAQNPDASPATQAGDAPLPADARVVRPREVTIISGSRFRVGPDRYQVFGVRAPRPRGGQCVMERLRGRQSRAALRRILSRGEIRIAPTGQLNPFGDKIARVTVDGQSVRRRLIDARAALPRRGNEAFNPWCISLRKPRS